MRIISGTAKGRKLHTPKGMDIRPTSDRVKEAIFNIIKDKVLDANILDLFAGTGNLGIEALSRGAKEAYFIDSKKNAIELIYKNLSLTNFKDKAKVIHQDAEKAIERLAKDGVKFDLIFLDPPYRISISFLSAILEKMTLNLLSENGFVILEHAKQITEPLVKGLLVDSKRIYGDTAITIYKKAK